MEPWKPILETSAVQTPIRACLTATCVSLLSPATAELANLDGVTNEGFESRRSRRRTPNRDFCCLVRQRIWRLENAGFQRRAPPELHFCVSALRLALTLW